MSGDIKRLRLIGVAATLKAGNTSTHMNEQHPDSGKGSGKRERSSKPDAHESPSTQEEVFTPSGRRITRKLGRPSVGKPEQVRLSDAEREIALAHGEGNLAKGVRNALNLIGMPGTKPSAQSKTTFTKAETAFAKELGEGDFHEGLLVALRAANFLGVETARKMKPNGPRTTRKG
jgi:hypothetical protein